MDYTKLDQQKSSSYSFNKWLVNRKHHTT